MSEHTPEPRCPEGYGVKSLRLLREAQKRGLRLSDDGDVILPTGKVHRPTPQDGRNRLNLSIDGERCTIQTARVVCFLARGEPDDPCTVVDHIDGDPLNDDPSNLRWASYSENLRNSEANRIGPTVSVSGMEDCKRVIACLKACAGIPTAALEGASVKALVEAAKAMRAELKEFYDGDAACDHSVNICYCTYWDRREWLDATLSPFLKGDDNAR